jgi:hypothetical protein
MLLACAESFTEIDETQLPTLVEIRTRNIPESAREILASLACPIGDIDYVRMDHYIADPTGLRKAGGGPSFDDIPKEARRALKLGKNQIMRIDSVGVGANPIKGVARVTVQERDYYIARPDIILGYKFLQLLLSYQQKPEEFNAADFGKLFRALEKVYNKGELIEITRQILTHYENAHKAWYFGLVGNQQNPRPYQNLISRRIETLLTTPQLPPEIRTMLESLKD